MIRMTRMKLICYVSSCVFSSNRVGWFYAEAATSADFIQSPMRQDYNQETWRGNADFLDAFYCNKNLGYAIVDYELV
jgi:hypothetical protein